MARRVYLNIFVEEYDDFKDWEIVLCWFEGSDTLVVVI